LSTRVVLAALTDGFLTEALGARDLARAAFFFFIADPLSFRI
jgi:hypothetical protein